MTTDDAEYVPHYEWKTGQRVRFTGTYRDQYGFESHHHQYDTFPPCIGRKGECAYRVYIRP